MKADSIFTVNCAESVCHPVFKPGFFSDWVSGTFSRAIWQKDQTSTSS
uniref:Uncharacterized protein n=1 Tax=Rhizophora mucronata TaxID=61149 RepID=A0A2P2NIA7_RHIMU